MDWSHIATQFNWMTVSFNVRYDKGNRSLEKSGHGLNDFVSYQLIKNYSINRATSHLYLDVHQNT